MKGLLTICLICLFAVGPMGCSYVPGTADEAKAMVEKAAAFMKANGKEKAFREFTEGTAFKKNDLYIFVVNMDGVILAHGSNPKLVGKDMSNLKDAGGKLFITEIINEANAKGNGWSDYKWANPVSKKIDLKSTYFLKTNDVIIGCGIYKH
jgi:signal transduction histidine kinase